MSDQQPYFNRLWSDAGDEQISRLGSGATTQSMPLPLPSHRWVYCGGWDQRAQVFFCVSRAFALCWTQPPPTYTRCCFRPRWCSRVPPTWQSHTRRGDLPLLVGKPSTNVFSWHHLYNRRKRQEDWRDNPTPRSMSEPFEVVQNRKQHISTSSPSPIRSPQARSPQVQPTIPPRLPQSPGFSMANFAMNKNFQNSMSSLPECSIHEDDDSEKACRLNEKKSTSFDRSNVRCWNFLWVSTFDRSNVKLGLTVTVQKRNGSFSWKPNV